MSDLALASYERTRNRPRIRVVPKSISIFMIFFAFFCLQFVVRPMHLIAYGVTKHAAILDDLNTLVVVGSALGALFLMCAWLGYRFVPIRMRVRSLTRPRFTIFGKVVVINVCLLVCYVIVENASQLSAIIVSFRKGEGPSLAMSKAALQALNLFFLFALFELQRGRGYAATGFLLSLFACLFLGDRSILILPFVVAVYIGHRRGKISATTMFAGALAVIYLLALLGMMRFYLLYGVLQLPSFATILSHGVNAVAYDQFLLYLNEFSFRAVRFGADFLNGLLGFVPRSIWENKPQFITPGAWLGFAIYGRSDLGLPFTTPGLWFANFGVLGVLFGGVLSGITLKVCEVACRTGREVYGGTAFFYCFVAGFSAMSFMRVVITIVVPVLALVFLTKRRSLRVIST